MAEEISVSARLRANKSYLQVDRQANYKVDMTGNKSSTVTQSIGTSDEALAINSDIGTAGVGWLRNLDATNYVTVGVRDGSATYIPLLKLKPGEAQLVRFATNTIYAKANTATVVLEHTVCED